jgi:hypothetical protein
VAVGEAERGVAGLLPCTGGSCVKNDVGTADEKPPTVPSEGEEDLERVGETVVPDASTAAADAAATGVTVVRGSKRTYKETRGSLLCGLVDAFDEWTTVQLLLLLSSFDSAVEMFESSSEL